MQFQFKLKIGQTEFTFGETATTQTEFFKKVSFYTSLPQVGPNGEDDLVVVFRTTKEGHEYYSLISDKAGMEYKFGQSQKAPGELFGKGWEPKYVPEQAVAATPGVQAQVQPQPQTQIQPQVQQQVQPQVQQQVVQQQPQVQQQQVVQQQPQVQQQVVQQQAPAAQNQATDILKQFGVN